MEEIKGDKKLYLEINEDIEGFGFSIVNNGPKIPREIIDDIKSNGVKVGISLNPDTKLDTIYEYLPYIHKVLVMTVVPGKGGQNLIPETIEKIKELKKYIEENKLETIIEADGGINDENIEVLKNVGVEIVVAGTYIISAENMKEAILSLK